jgi:predicted AAA+ superfamily ATPase
VSPTEELVLTANPWWTNPDWEAADPYLRRLRAHPVRLPAPLVETLDLSKPGVHIVKGPRQVGKSTDLKLLAQRHLEATKNRFTVIYLPLDLLLGGSPADVDALVRLAKRRSGNLTGQLLLLDEVTAVPGWRVGVKALWDAGIIDQDIVVCTGSSAIDLDGEGLPGRRGAGRDHMVLPQSFGTFARALFPELPPRPNLRIADLFGAEGARALDEALLYGPRLEDAFDKYMRFGGMPAAVSEAVIGEAWPSEEVRAVLTDSLGKDGLTRGLREPALFALLGRVLRSLGSKTSYSGLAREMDVPLGTTRLGGSRPPDYRTVKEHLESLAAAYQLLIVYFWRPDAGSADLSRDKKLYFADPLLHTIAEEKAPGLATNQAALVENAIALGLYRRYEPQAQRMAGFHLPIHLHVWETSRREIDFVCGPRRELEIAEVKWQRAVTPAEARKLHLTLPQRPAVVVTQSSLEVGKLSALIPAHLFVWLLG